MRKNHQIFYFSKAIQTYFFLPSIFLSLNGCLDISAFTQFDKLDHKTSRTTSCKRLHHYIKKWKYEAAITVVETEDVDVNCRDKKGNLPLLEVNRAISQEEATKLVDAIIEHHTFHPNDLNSQGENSLFAHRLELAEIKTLVDKGANINQTNLSGQTPLNAISSHHNDIANKIAFFIEHKTYRKNQFSLNRMLFDHHNASVLAYLIKKGAHVDFDIDNRSPLHNLLGGPPLPKAILIIEQAIKQGFELKQFLNHPTKITSGLNPMVDGDTALHEAVRHYAVYKPSLNNEEAQNYKSLIDHFLSWGADPDLKNRAGKTPRDLAREHGFTLPAAIPRVFPNAVS